MSWFRKLLGIKEPEASVQFADSIRLKWGKYFWEGDAVLPAWAGFQERLGPYAWESGPGPSTGTVHLSIASPVDSTAAPPSEAQTRAFRFVQDNDRAIQEKVVKAIFEVYPEWRENFKDLWGDELDEKMPVLQSPSDLKQLMGLSTVHILPVEKDDFAYVGFEFGCTWEEEHGLGVLTYKDQIVDVGEAESSFNKSVAAEHKSK